MRTLQFFSGLYVARAIKVEVVGKGVEFDPFKGGVIDLFPQLT